MLPATVIKIGDTRGAAMAIGLHPESVTLRPDFAAAGLLCQGNDARERAGLRSHLAAETQAAPAMDAPRPAPVRLGKNRHGRGEGMPAELPGGTLKDDSRGFYRHRRQRIGFGAIGIKGARTGESRNADLPFHLGVIRFHLRVGQRPVGERRARHRPAAAALDKIDFVEPPEVGRKVYGASAHATPVDRRELLFGLVLRGLAKGLGLPLEIVSQGVFLRLGDFIVPKIAGRDEAPLLQHHHLEARRGEFLGQHSARRAGADDDEVNFF